MVFTRYFAFKHATVTHIIPKRINMFDINQLFLDLEELTLQGKQVSVYT